MPHRQRRNSRQSASSHSRQRPSPRKRTQSLRVSDLCLAWPRAGVSPLSTTRYHVIADPKRVFRWENAAIENSCTRNHHASAGALPLHSEFSSRANPSPICDPKTGVQGQRPCANEVLRSLRRQNAAVSHRWGRPRPMETRNPVAVLDEASARGRAKQWAWMHREEVVHENLNGHAVTISPFGDSDRQNVECPERQETGEE